MIAVIVPVWNEEERIGACLRALFRAARHPGLASEPVRVWVVLNGCTDRSEAVVRETAAELLVLEQANVGRARAAGCDQAIADGARWLAFTDADTIVAPDWFVAQLQLGADVVCGTVQVDDWSAHGEHAPHLDRHFRESYTDRDCHAHVHGANLGVSTAAYVAAGGFPALACSEDVALVETLQRSGASIAWSARPRVTTSARRDARARGGFGDTLLAVVRGMQGEGLGGLSEALAPG